MPNYRRAKEGNTYFFTVVTYQRKPILCLEESRNSLREVIKDVRLSYPFKIEAWVLLPDHLHCIWKLPEGDIDYSMRWGLIKKEFTKRMQGSVNTIPANKTVGTAHPTRSRQRHREGTIWQRRFWEHQIRNEQDFNNHCDYIHYNPVKHGLVNSPKDWLYSTFHEFVKKEICPIDWGSEDIQSSMEFPEDIGNE